MARNVTNERMSVDTLLASSIGLRPIYACEKECANVVAEWIARVEAQATLQATWNAIRSYVATHATPQRNVLTLSRNVTSYGKGTITGRDITRNVQRSAVRIGDATQNGHRRYKLSGTHAATVTTYVVSDTLTTDTLQGTVTTQRKRGGIPLLRNADGTVDTVASLTLISEVARLRANRKVQL